MAEIHARFKREPGRDSSEGHEGHAKRRGDGPRLSDRLLPRPCPTGLALSLAFGISQIPSPEDSHLKGSRGSPEARTSNGNRLQQHGRDVEWSYHIATVVTVPTNTRPPGTQDLVIDPALSDHPLTVDRRKELANGAKTSEKSVISTEPGPDDYAKKGDGGQVEDYSSADAAADFYLKKHATELSNAKQAKKTSLWLKTTVTGGFLCAVRSARLTFGPKDSSAAIRLHPGGVVKVTRESELQRHNLQWLIEHGGRGRKPVAVWMDSRTRELLLICPGSRRQVLGVNETDSIARILTASPRHLHFPRSEPRYPLWIRLVKIALRSRQELVFATRPGDGRIIDLMTARQFDECFVPAASGA